MYLSFISTEKNHGFPNVMGVLTHIDFFKDNKQLRKTRKKYKKRFEYEVGSGYKLFYLSGLKNTLYLKHDIANLARFISFIRYTPVRWKSEHSFILSDRFEKVDDERTAFFGYVRGCTYRLGDRVHFVGMGDFELESMDTVPDPCAPIAKANTMRTLKQSDKLIYAPMTNLGFLAFDSAYINIPD
jgi:ribosome biogenesis protein BMS1